MYVTWEIQAVRNLKKIKRVFSNMGVDMVVLYGTALGFARGGEVIPRDWDCDIGVVAETVEDIAVLEAALQDEGFGCFFALFGNTDTKYISVIRCGMNGVKAWEPECHCGATMDIHFYYKKSGDEGGLWWLKYEYNGCLLGERVPVEMFKRFDRVKAHGEWFNTLAPLEDYLTLVYGDDWRIPKEGTGKLPLEPFAPGFALDDRFKIFD
jgi:hypothetical protein